MLAVQMPHLAKARTRPRFGSRKSTPKTKAREAVHRGFDWLIFGHFRMGRFSGATSSSMLRATPGWRRIKPARSMVRTI